MFANREYRLCLWIAAAVLSTAAPAACRAADELAALVEEYRAHGLPMPPTEAVFARRRLDWLLRGGPAEPDYYPALVIEPRGKHPAAYWLGLYKFEFGKEAHYEKAPPTADVFSKTERIQPIDEPWGLPTFANFVLAIQFKARGWDDIARLQLERAYNPWLIARVDPIVPLPGDKHKALALVAWGYWCNEYSNLAVDRKEVLARLKKLLDGPYGLANEARQTIVEDMERSLLPSQAPPDSLEAAVDGLLECDPTRGFDDHWGLRDSPERVRTNADYFRLLETGLAAAPVLIRHLDDFRLTRGIRTGYRHWDAPRYVWHLRVADVVAELLEDLCDDRLAYDFLARQGRGRCLDRRAVLDWWSKQEHRLKEQKPRPDESKKPTPRRSRDLMTNASYYPYAFENSPHPLATAVAERRTAEAVAILKEKPWLAKWPSPALARAVENDDLPMVKLLLACGASPDVLGRRSLGGPYTAFSEAVQHEQWKAAQLLVKNATVADAVGFKRKFAINLLCFAILEREAKWVQVLLAHGADPNVADFYFRAMPLHLAAAIGDISKTKLLLEHGAEVAPVARCGATPLLIAAANGHKDIGMLLVERGATLDVLTAAALDKTAELAAMLKADPSLVAKRDPTYRCTPLHFAARNGAVGAIRLLLEQKADPNARAPCIPRGHVPYDPVKDSPEDNMRPLHCAVVGGHIAAITALLDAGADINAEPPYWYGSPLYEAAQSGNIELTRLLLARKADPNANAEEGWNPLYGAVAHPKTVALLLDAGANPNATRSDGSTPLRLALNDGHHETARLLLSRGAKLDLYAACVFGNTDKVAEILTQPAERLKRGIDERIHMVLETAAQHGHLEIVKLAVAKGARLNQTLPWWKFGQKTESKSTSWLHSAAWYGHREVAAYLLDQGVPIDSHDYYDGTPLHQAARYAHPEVVKLFLERGAKVNGTDTSKGTPLLYCSQALRHYYKKDPENMRRRQAVAARFLIAAGADVHAVDESGWTPLHHAAHDGAVELAEVLLQNGAKVNQRNPEHWTPLGIAATTRSRWNLTKPVCQPMVELLKKHGGTP